MGLNGLLGLARDSLMTQAYALDITGQNVANVNTPGYARRVAVIENRPTGGGALGGVDAKGLQRAFDKFTEQRFFEATGFSASADARSQALSPIEAMFNDANGTGLSQTISALFTSFSALSANPSDMTVRSTMLSRAGDFANKLNQTASGITQQRADLLSQGQATVLQINDLAKQIATLNKQIAQAEASGATPADLMDRRDQVVASLSEKVDTQVITDESGRFLVRTAGAMLVNGENAGTLGVTLNPNDSSMMVTMQFNGGSPSNVTGQLSGGTLAGIRDARDVDAVAVLQKLDTLANDIATAVNTQHAAGFGLDGTGGRPLFDLAPANPPNPAGSAATIKINVDMIGHPELLAASSNASTVPGAGDNALALARLASQPIATGATRTPAEAYSDLVGDVGLRKSSADQEVQIRADMKAQVTTMRESTRGVSMDEEMVNLSKYQRAYQAATKLLQTADELLAGLIQEL